MGLKYRNMSLLLSIIVPVYNVEKYLKKCLDSILTQGFNDFELILVNDGSTDDSLRICRQYETKDTRVVVIDKPNGGLSSARNSGLSVVRGNYISFIDSDDFISADFYEANMKFLMQNTNVDMMILPYCKYSDKEKVFYKDDSRVLCNRSDVLDYLFSEKYNCAVWRCIYKSDVFLYPRFTEGRLFEDAYILPEIAQHVSALAVSETGCYYYVVRTGSICNSNYSLKKCTQQLDAFKKMQDYCITMHLDSKVFAHYYLSYSYLITKAVSQHGYQELVSYVQDWNSKCFLQKKALRLASLKYKIIMLLIMLGGFKFAAKVIGRK